MTTKCDLVRLLVDLVGPDGASHAAGTVMEIVYVSRVRTERGYETRYHLKDSRNHWSLQARPDQVGEVQG